MCVGISQLTKTKVTTNFQDLTRVLATRADLNSEPRINTEVEGGIRYKPKKAQLPKKMSFLKIVVFKLINRATN